VRRSGWVSLLLVLALAGAAWAVLARQLFLVQQVWLAVAAPSLALGLTFLASLGYAAVLERRLRDFVASAVGRAIPSEVFGRLESNIGLMRPVRRPMAIYVSSLEGFTTASDTQKPAKVVADLQEYLGEVTRIIVKQRGQPDKYLGDGVLAFWGAPVRVDDPVMRACEAALKMRQSVLSMHAAWEKDLGQPVVLRAGIDFGETLVGEMGTEHRLNYSVMGLHVSMAFKLSTLARRYGVEVLVGENVPKEAGDRFLFREVDLLARRSGSPMRVFELVGRTAEVALHEVKLRRYNTAYDALRARRFEQALIEFEALAKEFSDSLSSLHAERCRQAIKTPPAADWDGVWPDEGFMPLARGKPSDPAP
jgi:adenylate cyclase